MVQIAGAVSGRAGRAWYGGPIGRCRKDARLGGDLVFANRTPFFSRSVAIPVVRSLVAGLLCALAAPSVASAGVDGQCPPVAEKPDAVDHVDYDDVQHLTYC